MVEADDLKWGCNEDLVSDSGGHFYSVDARQIGRPGGTDGRGVICSSGIL